MISILGDSEAIKSLSQGVRAERLRQNLTQNHVASIVGISLPTYRKIEKGSGSVEFRHVVRTLGVLGYADALAKLIPSNPPEIRLQDLLTPERKYATSRRARK